MPKNPRYTDNRKVLKYLNFDFELDFSELGLDSILKMVGLPVSKDTLTFMEYYTEQTSISFIWNILTNPMFSRLEGENVPYVVVRIAVCTVLLKLIEYTKQTNMELLSDKEVSSILAQLQEVLTNDLDLRNFIKEVKTKET